MCGLYPLSRVVCSSNTEFYTSVTETPKNPRKSKKILKHLEKLAIGLFGPP